MFRSVLSFPMVFLHVQAQDGDSCHQHCQSVSLNSISVREFLRLLAYWITDFNDLFTLSTKLDSMVCGTGETESSCAFPSPVLRAHLLLVNGILAFGLTGTDITRCACNFVSLFGKTKPLAMVLQVASPVVNDSSDAVARRYIGACGRQEASSRKTFDVYPRTRPLLIFSGILPGRLQCRWLGVRGRFSLPSGTSRLYTMTRSDGTSFQPLDARGETTVAVSNMADPTVKGPK